MFWGNCIGSLFFLCSGYDLNRNELETNLLYIWLLYWFVHVLFVF